jgi:hypothetical protein
VWTDRCPAPLGTDNSAHNHENSSRARLSLVPTSRILAEQPKSGAVPVLWRTSGTSEPLPQRTPYVSFVFGPCGAAHAANLDVISLRSMGVLRKLVRLAPAERRLVRRALFLIAAIRLGLWMLPLRVLRRTLAQAGRRKPAHEERASLPAGDLALAVRRAARFVPRASCLAQALAVQYLLARQGMPSEVHLGISKRDGDLAAHAWVEWDGQVIACGGDCGDYVPLASWGAGSK